MLSPMILAIAVLAVFVTLVPLAIMESGTRQQKTGKKYHYKIKPYIMTANESGMFRDLNDLFGDKYYVFPQVSLASLVSEKVPGQDWRAARSVINRKTVDFALVDKTTLKTVCAIELDDTSHSDKARRNRDELVEEILGEAGLKLVRIAALPNQASYKPTIRAAFRGEGDAK